MVNFRRFYIEGGCYFFTVTLKNRKSRLLIEKIGLLRQAFQQVKQENPFTVEAIVILPDHFHTIWKLPEQDTNYSDRMRKIKSYFTLNLKKSGIIISCNQRAEHQLWQRRFWEHTIFDETDYEEHVNYIHYNPVKHGWVNEVNQWPYSSFHQFVAQQLLPKNWAGKIKSSSKRNYGE
ncbi:MAG: transposase [Legionellales bacterium]|nr:transposase [Legionellales bacterium]